MESKTLTFGELDEMVDTWVGETVECHKRFQNQADDNRRWFYTVSYNNQQLKNINTWLSVLFHYDKCLTQDILTISKYQARLEHLVKKLEKACPHMTDLRSVDPIRTEMFDSMSNVYLSICTIMERVQEIVDTCKDFDHSSMQEPFEQLAKIMMTDIRLLEQIENKLSCMNTCLLDIERKKDCLVKKQMNKMQLMVHKK